jgi:hypothetical protein
VGLRLRPAGRVRPVYLGGGRDRDLAAEWTTDTERVGPMAARAAMALGLDGAKPGRLLRQLTRPARQPGRPQLILMML